MEEVLGETLSDVVSGIQKIESDAAWTAVGKSRTTAVSTGELHSNILFEVMLIVCYDQRSCI